MYIYETYTHAHTRTHTHTHTHFAVALLAVGGVFATKGQPDEGEPVKPPVCVCVRVCVALPPFPSSSLL